MSCSYFPVDDCTTKKKRKRGTTSMAILSLPAAIAVLSCLKFQCRTVKKYHNNVSSIIAYIWTKGEWMGESLFDTELQAQLRNLQLLGKGCTPHREKEELEYYCELQRWTQCIHQKCQNLKHLQWVPTSKLKILNVAEKEIFCRLASRAQGNNALKLNGKLHKGLALDVMQSHMHRSKTHLRAD